MQVEGLVNKHCLWVFKGFGNVFSRSRYNFLSLTQIRFGTIGPAAAKLDGNDSLLLFSKMFWI